MIWSEFIYIEHHFSCVLWPALMNLRLRAEFEWSGGVATDWVMWNMLSLKLVAELMPRL